MFRALERNARSPNVQDLPALCGYLLLKGHAWADSTAIGDALDEIGTGETLGPLGPALVRCLENRARMDGDGYSVADVTRVNWHARRVRVWDREIGASCAIGWPGGQAWRDLRVAHLVADGWTTGEIARLTGSSPRSVRKRRDRIARSFTWTAIAPISLLGE